MVRRYTTTYTKAAAKYQREAGEFFDFLCKDDVVVFAGVKFGFDDKIRVTLGRDFDEREGLASAFQHKYGRGSWGRFGFSEEAIIDMAVRIVDMRTMKTIYEGPCTSEPWDLSDDWYLIENFDVKPSERARISMAKRRAGDRKRKKP